MRSDAARLALLLGLVRIGLGAAGVVAAALGDVSGGVTVLAAGLGALLTIFTLVAPGGRQRPALVPRPRVEARSLGPALAVAMYPSTYGVALLTTIALFVEGVLAAFLAGVLLGMGIVALAAAVGPHDVGRAGEWGRGR